MSKRPDDLKLGSRLVIGAVAGFVGTMAVGMALRRLHAGRAPKERSPLTPRAIVDSGAKQAGEAAKEINAAAHLAYGAATGAVLAAMNPDPGKRTGALYGAALWLAGSMGWIPAIADPKPATLHPPRRNFTMIGVHIVWGAATAVAIRALRGAREAVIGNDADRDVPR
ncbi:MAG TPA: hypothetical protein VFW19_11920 [Allosphingosinicella sp.]|nr:hypothetical protein [Allosphingosinicella sp.]